MAGQPSAGELVAAVREFLAGLTLAGRDAFHARVAANALAIVERELAADADAVEVAALRPFCHPRRRGDDNGPETAVKVHAAVSARLRAGDLDAATPGLLDALIVATVARLSVDNPRYPTLARLAPAPPASPNAAVRR